MRQTLQPRAGKHARFRAIFVRYEKKSTLRGPALITVCLRDITELHTNVIVTDHLWFTRNKSLEALGDLQDGDELEFNARVWSYTQVYQGYTIVKQLVNPITTANFKRVQRYDNTGNGNQ